MGKSISFIFSYQGTDRLLFTVTNIGSESNPDLKFVSHHGICLALGKGHDPYEFNEDNLTTSNVESTYHSDGAFMRKLNNIDYKQKKYYNYNGTGVRTTPLLQIQDIKLLSLYNIQLPQICETYFQKKKDTSIIKIQADALINNGAFVAILFIKHKNKLMNQLVHELFCSHYVPISQELDICIYISRIATEYPQKRYSNKLKCEFWTTINNEVIPLNEENSTYVNSVIQPEIFSEDIYNEIRSRGLSEPIHIHFENLIANKAFIQ